MQPVIKFVADTFPSAVLREQHHNMLQYQLGSQNLSLSQLFAAMEEAKSRLNVEDYSVSQTTLDQVIPVSVLNLKTLFRKLCALVNTLLTHSKGHKLELKNNKEIHFNN